MEQAGLHTYTVSSCKNEGCINYNSNSLINGNNIGNNIKLTNNDTYCADCFSTVFESTFNLNNGKNSLKLPPKAKPPPPPTKPTKDKKLMDPTKSTISQPGSPFICKICSTSLHGKMVESLLGEVYCRPCYDEHIKKIRCTACHESFTKGLLNIHSENLDNVMMLHKQKPFHVGCFCCSQCEKPLGSKSFTRNEDEDTVCCEDCYFEKSGKTCAKCNKVFSTTGVWFKNRHYHKSCFTCAFCVQELGDKDVFLHESKVFCGPCYDEQFLKKCYACHKPMIGEIIEYEGHTFHVSCFVCNACERPVGDQSFIPREGNLYCENCFCMKFGKMCYKCGLVISPTSGKGLVFRGKHYHLDCFTCSNCNGPLSDQLVHSHKDADDIFYCGNCYDELFSKKCNGCSGIISGVIGSKYIAHEGLFWHETCFNCSNCGSSLSNRKVALDSTQNLTCAPCLMTRNLTGN